MAMDLSTHRQQGDLNNNLACSAVVDLSLPRKEKKEDVENRSDFADLSKLVKEDKDTDAKLVVGEGNRLSELLGLVGKDPSVLESLLPQLDVAAINLLCLARLQVRICSRIYQPCLDYSICNQMGGNSSFAKLTSEDWLIPLCSHFIHPICATT